MHERTRTSCWRPLAAGAALAVLAVVGSPARAQTADQEVRELRREVERMRGLIEEQQRQIRELQERTRQTTEDAALARTTAEDAKRQVGDAAEQPLITSTSSRVKVAVSGQVNRLLNFAGDGRSPKFYFVDNNISVSRLRVDAEGQVSDDLSVGSTIELAISPNNSAEVSQVDEEGTQRDEFRKVEALFKSKAYGDIAFGRGDPATKDITRIDLSGTDVLAYANSGDPVGGLIFRADDGEALSGTTVSEGFTDFDSGRQNRIRYDTPRFGGAYASISGSADQRWGAAVRWGGTGHGLRAGAGIGVHDPSDQDVNAVFGGSASALHEATGLNLTVASAYQDADEGGSGQLYYVKGGWQHDFFTWGKSAFSLDYGRNVNAPASDSDGQTVGLVALQNIARYGTELFAGLRLYDLDEADGTDLETIYVATVGTRVKF